MTTDFLIIGHRGAAGEFFENSLEGFEYAVSINVDAIELDIQEHQNELWVFHDDTMDRLSGASGPFAQQPDIASIKLNNGQAIPRLTEVLDLCWGKIPLNIEAKSIQNVELLLNLLKTYGEPRDDGPFPWILISSFDHDVLFELKQRQCHWPLAPISEVIPDNYELIIDRLAPYSWHLDDEQLDFSRLADLHRSGIRSFVYTVNSIERGRKLRDSGVSGLFTDLPSHF